MSSISPYEPGTLEAWSWHRGFIEGAAKRLGRCYSDIPAAGVEWPRLPTHSERNGQGRQSPVR